jgi:hypothetical protein
MSCFSHSCSCAPPHACFVASMGLTCDTAAAAASILLAELQHLSSGRQDRRATALSAGRLLRARALLHEPPTAGVASSPLDGVMACSPACRLAAQRQAYAAGGQALLVVCLFLLSSTTALQQNRSASASAAPQHDAAVCITSTAPVPWQLHVQHTLGRCQLTLWLQGTKDTSSTMWAQGTVQ